MTASHQTNTRESSLSFAYAEDLEPVQLVDRSTLERFGICPAQARLIDSGRVNNNSMIAAAGEAVHQAFGAAIQEYMADPMLPHWEIAEAAFSALRCSRPDIQPDALAGGKPSVYAWARFLSSVHPHNIIRYDGGEGDRSGQLAVDMEIGDTTLRVTSELDLLLASESPEIVREIDYKSGWKKYTSETVADSFQFQLHAWLVLKNYPAIDALSVKVWNCRSNSLSHAVVFERHRMGEIETRIRSAAGYYHQYRDVVPEAAPVWPALEKCSMCPAAALCPAGAHCGDVARDPVEFIGLMVALDAKLDAMKKLAGAYVDKHGDIKTPSGCFGIDRPTSSKKPQKLLYAAKAEEESTDAAPA